MKISALAPLLFCLAPAFAAAPPEDHDAPYLRLTAPADGAPLSGVVAIVGSAAEFGSGLAGIQFKADGAAVGPEALGGPSYGDTQISWDTTLWPDGDYRLTGTARDYAGNVSTSNSIAVSIRNGESASPVASAVGTTRVAATYAALSWRTQILTNSVVEFGATPALGRTLAISGAPLTAHLSMLTGLLPATVYYYRIRSTSLLGKVSLSPVFQFMTAQKDAADRRSLRAGVSLVVGRRGLESAGVGAPSPTAAGEAQARPKALMLSRRSGMSQSLLFEENVQEAVLMSLQGRVLARAARQGPSLFIDLQGAGDAALSMESGLWIIKITASDGSLSLVPLVVVK